MGALSYVSWTQTPITPAIPAITNYSLPGHPRYDIEEGKPRYTQLKTGSVVSFTMPRTNRPHTINIPGGGHVYYRWVSPMAEKGFTAETALIVVDGNGTVSAGEYSPTVKMCYDLGIPVAVMPVTQQSDVKNTLEDTVMDIIDVADDIKKKNYAKNVTVLAEGELSQPALKTLSKRKTPIRNIVVYNPDVNVMKNKRQKKKHAITVVCDNEEQAQLYPQDITTRVIDSSSQEEQFISIVNIISDTV